MDQDATWYGGRRPRRQRVRWGPSSPRKRVQFVYAVSPHISTSGFCARASRASFIAFLQSLAPDHVASLDGYVVFDVKLRSLTLFPVFSKPEVVFNGQMVADNIVCCIKVE